MTTAYQETRTELIRRIARMALAARQLNLMLFADDFVTLAFEKAYASASGDTNLRVPHPADGTQHDKDRAHNRQIVERWVRGKVAAFPHDLEEAWVLALPHPWRDQALAELAARYGLLAAPAIDPNMALATMGETMRKFGAFMEAMTPIIEDGRIDENDRPHLKPALEQVGQLQSMLASVAQQLAKALPDGMERGAALRAVP